MIEMQSLNSIVSGALDRLHYENDPCVKYDSDKKLWIYLHKNRTIDYPEWAHQSRGERQNNLENNSFNPFIGTEQELMWSNSQHREMFDGQVRQRNADYGEDCDEEEDIDGDEDEEEDLEGSEEQEGGNELVGDEESRMGVDSNEEYGQEQEQEESRGSAQMGLLQQRVLSDKKGKSLGTIKQESFVASNNSNSLKISINFGGDKDKDKKKTAGGKRNY